MLGRCPRGTFPIVKGCGGKGNIFGYAVNDYLSLVAYCDSEGGVPFSRFVYKETRHWGTMSLF